MKKTLIAGALALGLAMPAMAQMPSGPIARADFLARGKAQIEAADTNHDGAITKEELTALFTKQMGNAPPQQMVDVVFGMFDTNGDGKATLAEIEAVQAKRFDELDTNHDGMLSPEEMEAGRAAAMAQAPK